MKPNVPMDSEGKPVHPIKADALKPVIKAYKNKGNAFKMGMVFPVSTHNYEIRYWLAAAGIHPGMYTADNVQGQIDAEVLLSVTPPPQMPATLEAGTIHGYCVGEPWNQQAVFKGIGVPVVTNYDIWKNNPEKVFVMTKKFVEENPNTAIAITKALIRAGKWLDEPGNRAEAVKILSMSQYVGADEAVLANSMTGTFEFEKGDIRDMPDFNVFYKYNATYPFYSDGTWFLTQMRRWGQIPEAKPVEWYAKTIKEIYRPDIWEKAAKILVEEGHIPASDIPKTDGYKPATADFIDGNTYDAKDPIGYINSFSIGNKD
jgi:nitrate/nitrite transport system substrate-binding protein